VSGGLQPALDWVQAYLENIRDLPVAARVAPGDIAARMPAAPPARGEPLEAVLADIDELLLPGVTHWNHPGFFGYFATTSSEPGIAGELLAAALNSNGMLWRTCPALTELELVATRWLAGLLALPEWFGLINDTASSSTLTALAAARHRADPEARTRGVAGGPPLAVYASEEAHSSVDKAVLTLGLGTASLRRIPTDAAFRMDPGALADRMRADAAAGVRPMAVVATVGTTVTTSIDPVAAVAELCAAHGAWLHVDGAYGAAAAAVPELRWVLDGAERADSLVVNPHKWLFVPVDCSVLYLRDPEATRAAFSVVPDYLRSGEDTPNLMDYGVALGRRFRALKLWMVLRCLGTDRIVAALREHVRLAGLLVSWVQEDPSFTLAAPAPLSVVNLRCTPPGTDPEEQDRRTRATVEAVNATGLAYLSAATIGGRPALHAAIGRLDHTEAGVAALWRLIRSAAGRTPAGGGS
jgi:aromatic-L-amino-acid decarboxylase